MDESLHFDPYQFRRGPFFKNNGLASEDWQRHHITRSKAIREKQHIPPWSQDDHLLQRVLLYQSWKYCHTELRRARLPMPWEKFEKLPLSDVRQLCRFATKQRKRWLPKQPQQRRLVNSHLKALHKRDYLSLLSSVAWLAWRTWYHSPDISRATGLKPVTVRRMLGRIAASARELETKRAKHSQKPQPFRRNSGGAFARHR